MSTSRDQRSFERIPCHQKIQVVIKGRMVAYAMAINIGMGGVLLSSAPSLPVGSQCQVAIPDGDGNQRLVAEGTVIRSDTDGTAVRFLRTLEPTKFDSVFQRVPGAPGGLLLASYRAYFHVSRNRDLTDCEKLLGVSKQTFKTTFYVSFLSCIALAILPVWLFRGSLPTSPNWIKVALSFGYGAIWLGIIQPSIDLTVFHFLRQRPSPGSRA